MPAPLLFDELELQMSTPSRQMEGAVTTLLQAIGEDPQREGL